MADGTKAQTVDPAQQLFQIAGGYILSSALYVVTEAGVSGTAGETIASAAQPLATCGSRDRD